MDNGIINKEEGRIRVLSGELESLRQDRDLLLERLAKMRDRIVGERTAFRDRERTLMEGIRQQKTLISELQERNRIDPERWKLKYEEKEEAVRRKEEEGASALSRIRELVEAADRLNIEKEELKQRQKILEDEKNEEAEKIRDRELKLEQLLKDLGQEREKKEDFEKRIAVLLKQSGEENKKRSELEKLFSAEKAARSEAEEQCRLLYTEKGLLKEEKEKFAENAAQLEKESARMKKTLAEKENQNLWNERKTGELNLELESAKNDIEKKETEFQKREGKWKSAISSLEESLREAVLKCGETMELLGKKEEAYSLQAKEAARARGILIKLETELKVRGEAADRREREIIEKEKLDKGLLAGKENELREFLDEKNRWKVLADSLRRVMEEKERGLAELRSSISRNEEEREEFLKEISFWKEKERAAADQRAKMEEKYRRLEKTVEDGKRETDILGKERARVKTGKNLLKCSRCGNMVGEKDRVCSSCGASFQ